MILLVDNGSLEPAATLSLRRIAARLGEALGQTIHPVSLLHSSKVAAEHLDGRPAETLDSALKQRALAGTTEFLLVPLFFGPSAALTDYLPKRIAKLKTRYPHVQVRVAPSLVDTADHRDERMARILADQVRSVAAPPMHTTAAAPIRPAVILVDHGSPIRAVTAVRDHLAAQLAQQLGDTVRGVGAASMERRAEPEYDFNEPLLDRAFDQPGFDTGPVIVALLFLSPGRHAGAGGDIANICAAAQQRHPTLLPTMTPLVGAHPDLIPILVDRVRAGLAAAPLIT